MEPDGGSRRTEKLPRLIHLWVDSHKSMFR